MTWATCSAWPCFEQRDWTEWSPEVPSNLICSVIILTWNLIPVGLVSWFFFNLSPFPIGEEEVLERSHPYLTSKVTVFQIATRTLFCRQMWAYSAYTLSHLEAATFLLAWHWVKANKTCWEAGFWSCCCSVKAVWFLIGLETCLQQRVL